jgi:hypothetical protein
VTDDEIIDASRRKPEAPVTVSWMGYRCGTGNSGLRTVSIYEWFADALQRRATIDLVGKTVGQWAWADADLFEQLLITEDHRSSLHMSDYALPRHRPELLDGGQPEALLLSCRHDGTRQGMLASLLEARRQAQDLLAHLSRRNERWEPFTGFSRLSRFILLDNFFVSDHSRIPGGAKHRPGALAIALPELRRDSRKGTSAYQRIVELAGIGSQSDEQRPRICATLLTNSFGFEIPGGF